MFKFKIVAITVAIILAITGSVCAAPAPQTVTASLVEGALVLAPQVLSDADLLIAEDKSEEAEEFIDYEAYREKADPGHPENATAATKVKPRIALTFDDGPSPKATALLLDGLAERGIKVTFFVLGENVSYWPELVKRAYDEGHLIGNHSYSHREFTKVSDEDILADFDKAADLIEKATGERPKYIRSPYGILRQSAREATGCIIVNWNMDPEDWRTKSVEATVNYTKQKIKDGSILLLHDIYLESVEAALQIIDELSEEYEFVRVDELLGDVPAGTVHREGEKIIIE